MTKRRTAELVAAALLGWMSVPGHAATPTATAVAEIDPASSWERFLATADSGTAFKAYDILDAVGYDGDTVDARRCASNQTAIAGAIAAAPVSLAIRRVA
jgi:hypothetical protein